jgi:serine phosphatase RsbU (regulator of sigma subunit)/Tfp pilus assembly protein PilF
MLFVSFSVLSQSEGENQLSETEVEIQSINSIIKRKKEVLHDTIVVDYYLQLARIYDEEFDYGASILYCDTILKEYPKLDFYRLKEIEELRANYLKKAGKTDEAIKSLLKILSEYEDKKDFEESAALNKRIGVIFLKMNDLKNAEYHLEESIQHARKVGDTETEGYSLMSLGNRYKKANRFKEAEAKYRKSIEIGKREGYKRLLAGNYNNYGSLYRMTNQPAKAMKYYKMAVNLNKEIGNDKWLSYNYNNLGNIYKERKDYQEALRYFFLSTSIKDKLGDYGGRVQTLANISAVYDSLGNQHQAYRFHKLHSSLKDSIARLNNADLAKKLAAEFQSEKREAEIIQLNMQDELNKQELQARDERISYQNFLGWLLGLGIFLILVIALGLWRTVVNRKKVNEELHAKNLQIDQQHNEIIDSINYAKRIQNSILPASDRLKRLLKNYAVLYKPKDIISGDFYICEESEKEIYFGTVDCTGHGVPGAMVSLVASSHLNKMIHELHLQSPGQVLDQLNKEVPEALAAENEVINDGMDLALCVLSKDRKKLQFAGAHQNCWVLNSKESIEKRDLTHVNHVLHVHGEFAIIELKGDRRGIGKSASITSFATQTIDLEPGDTLMMSTDGFQDQFGGPNNKKFKVKEMRNVVFRNGIGSPNEILQALESALATWQGGQEQIDDICLMIVEV